MPAADTECFQIFLDALAKKFARQYILLFVDGAGNHSSGNLVTLGTVLVSSGGTWTLTSENAFGLTAGTYTLYAVAQDSDGVFGDPDALTLQVL